MPDDIAAPRGLLVWRDPPDDLAAHVLGFVHRDERQTGQVQRVLPEARASIQVMVADPYWLRPREGGRWRRLPRVALWGPRHTWAYGFAAHHVQAFAVGLTGLGARRLLGGSVAGAVDAVLALDDVAPALAGQLAPRPGDSFDGWMERARETLRAAFPAAAPRDPIDASLAVLATAEDSAVAAAAASVGLSERQYRRLFRERHGVTPKRFHRVLRVDRMLRQLHDRPWEADGFDGYPVAFADQAHAIREFRFLTGLTPLQYARAKINGDATLRSVPAPGVPAPDILRQTRIGARDAN